ncbi:hypothetical protein PITCH_A560012 [uncultured Desulfobacterium sp.]|uniref:Uncharacterized protein n=1 Tax=uncultured Desulfobacterium sp. TaxID=201089 RepID=A0A445N182_9BACT|nr:hypothetical protein PITCH_A560012 [uncultured Desulfobacterium sp.]
MMESMSAQSSTRMSNRSHCPAQMEKTKVGLFIFVFFFNLYVNNLSTDRLGHLFQLFFANVININLEVTPTYAEDPVPGLFLSLLYFSSFAHKNFRCHIASFSDKVFARKNKRIYL